MLEPTDVHAGGKRAPEKENNHDFSFDPMERGGGGGCRVRGGRPTTMAAGWMCLDELKPSGSRLKLPFCLRGDKIEVVFVFGIKGV